MRRDPDDRNGLRSGAVVDGVDRAADREAGGEVARELCGERRLVEVRGLSRRQPRRRAEVVRADDEVTAEDPHRVGVLRQLDQALPSGQVALALVVEPRELGLHPEELGELLPRDAAVQRERRLVGSGHSVRIGHLGPRGGRHARGLSPDGRRSETGTGPRPGRVSA